MTHAIARFLVRSNVAAWLAVLTLVCFPLTILVVIAWIIRRRHLAKRAAVRAQRQAWTDAWTDLGQTRYYGGVTPSLLTLDDTSEWGAALQRLDDGGWTELRFITDPKTLHVAGYQEPCCPVDHTLDEYDGEQDGDAFGQYVADLDNFTRMQEAITKAASKITAAGKAGTFPQPAWARPL